MDAGLPGRERGSGRGGLRGLRTFDSLQVPAFRWYLIASFGAFSAMTMQLLVTGYLVFVLTGSYAALGTVALADAAPGLLLTVYGGVIADRLPKRLVIQAGQITMAGIAIVIAVLLFLDVLQFWHLLVGAAAEGVVLALMMPSRQSMLPEVVGMDRLQNAVALNMGGMSAVRLFAPAAGGFLLAVTGAGYVYLVMAGFYLFSVVALFKVPAGSAGASAATAHAGSSRGGGLRDVIDGFRYLRTNRTVLVLLLVNLAIVLFSMPYMFMLPGYVLDVFERGPETIGMLSSVAAVGSLAGTFVIASMPSRRRGLLLLAGSFAMGVGLIAFTLTAAVWVAAGAMVIVAVGQTFRMSLGNVLVQAYVDDAYRGRVISIFMMQWALASLGTFVLGIVTSIIGPQAALQSMAGILLVLTAVVLLLVPRIRELD